MNELLEFISLNYHKSNTTIAKEFTAKHNLDPFKVDTLRKRISKLKHQGKVFPKILEQPQEIKKEVEKEVKSDRVVLVIGDLHCPAVHPEYLNFNIQLKEKFNVTDVVFIGDIVDNHSTSYHEHNPNLPSPIDELKKAKEELAKWYKAFPNAVVTIGNHDLLYKRKITSGGLPIDIMKPFEQILGVDKWKVVNDYVIGNTYFTHGTGLSQRTIKEKALRLQKSVVCGHLHSKCYIDHISQNLFVSHIGCGIDFKALNYEYAKGGVNEPILSSLIIMNGLPILIKM